MPTSFDLAPPPVTTGGTTVVPVDVQSIEARLVFDGATSTATGDATTTFVVGPTSGRPHFDLRQVITGVWLDGASLPVTDVGTRDLGGGAGAELRVLEVDLASGTTHTLRLTYDLGLPSTSLLGSYAPGLAWSAGPRLAWNVGFTDLRPARYLEAWVPAPLVWDQFTLHLEVQVTGTGVAHTLITNGAVATLGPNHWTADFPATTTALSTLVEVRADDTLVTASGSAALAGGPVSVQGFALSAATTAATLAARLAQVKGWLEDNDAQIGPYAHGHRFTFLLHQGGMEYDGACTSGAGALQHETFHSWWGRAVRPASQADGWFDEGWNTYHDEGGTGAVALSFANPPVTLCDRNPYGRTTPGTAYAAGSALFNGIAALSSPAALTGWMGSFYAAHRDRPVTTLDLEAHLLARAGQPDVVDCFHRFVYGLPEPSPSPDLWLRDDPGHAGSETWPGRFWDSPDLWIRHDDDGGTTHQSPITGRDNWFHARIRNQGQGVARHFMVTFQVRTFAGVEFSWPADFVPSVTATGGFDLAPGASTVVRARWPAALVPPAGTHACWLAAVLTRGDRPVAGRRVWEHGNLAQKNLTVVRLRPGQRFVLPFLVRGAGASRPRHLELRRPDALLAVEARLAPLRPRPFPPADLEDATVTGGAGDVGGEQLDCGRLPGPPPEVDVEVVTTEDDADRNPLVTHLREFAPVEAETLARVPDPHGRGPGRLVAGHAAAVRLPLPAGLTSMGLTLTIPDTAAVGARGVVDLVERDDEGHVVGGVAVDIEIVD